MPHSLPKWLYNFKFAPAMYEWTSLSKSLPGFDVIIIFYCSHSERGAWYLIVVLICPSLTANNGEHLFMCLFAHLFILISEMSAYAFCPFSNGIICFITVGFGKFFIDSRYKFFVKYVVCIYFLLVCNLSFSLNRFFGRAKVLNFDKVQFINFSAYGCAFGVKSE